MSERKDHWETVYRTKQPHEVSWTQEIPQTSLEAIRKLNLPKTARIIDVGGGDSKLVDFLIEEGFINITVLDISENALERAKVRLGEKAKMVNWIASDITLFNPETKYDLWHDRAVFHFLTTPEHIERYLETTRNWVIGYLLMATFSENGPEKCSGLQVSQYSSDKLASLFSEGFELQDFHTEDHITPFGTKQNFLFCSLRRIFSDKAC